MSFFFCIEAVGDDHADVDEAPKPQRAAPLMRKCARAGVQKDLRWNAAEIHVFSTSSILKYFERNGLGIILTRARGGASARGPHGVI